MEHRSRKVVNNISDIHYVSMQRRRFDPTKMPTQYVAKYRVARKATFYCGRY